MIRFIKTAFATVVGLTTAQLAVAQSSGRTTLEEVIVTAQRVEQNLQEVPTAVTALSARDLEVQGIEGAEGLTLGTVPSIQVANFSARPGTLQIFIRGVGATDPGADSYEQPIAVYTDGVYHARGHGIGFAVAELERMEVLRGPQGTLFGRNALGGAVNMVTRKPGGKLRFKQLLDYGRFDTFKSHTTFETPAWNDLALKFDYRHSETDGWQDNPWTGAADGRNDLASDDQDMWRIAARWQPADSLTVDYSFSKTELEYVQGFPELVIDSDVAFLSRFLQDFVSDGRTRNLAAPGLYAPPNNQELKGHTLVIEGRINDALTVKSITGYSELLVEVNAGLNGFGIISPTVPGLAGRMAGGLHSDQFTDQDQFQQEIQLLGNTDRLKYVVGAMYFTEDIAYRTFTRYSAAAPLANPTAWAPLDTFVETPRTSTGVDLKSYGVYGQLTWTPPVLDDRLDITVGLRYSNEDKQVLRTELLGQPVRIPADSDEERVDPAVTLDYRIADSTMVYARWATAFRGGGASLREVPDTRPGFENDTGFNPFGVEEVDSYEVGLKSDFWNNRARLNLAAFYQDYKDMQTSFQKDSFINTRVFNLDQKVKLKGFEVEFTSLPIDNLTLSLNTTYLHNNVDSVNNPANNNQQEPFRMSMMPDWAWSASADYRFPVNPFGGELTLFTSLSGSTDYCFNGRSCFDRFEKLRGGTKSLGDDKTLLTARLTLSDIRVGEGGSLKVSLWGANLLDKEYLEYGYSVPGLNIGTAQYADPRTYGVSLTYEFNDR